MIFSNTLLQVACSTSFACFLFVVISGSTSIGQQILQVSVDVGSVPGIVFGILSIRYVRGETIVKGEDNSTIASAFLIDPYTGKVRNQTPCYSNAPIYSIINFIHSQLIFVGVDRRHQQQQNYHPVDQLSLM